MTDRPIIFSAPMVQALLAGRKTQTRRVLNPQPYGSCCGFQKVFADLPYFEALDQSGKPLDHAFPGGGPYPKVPYAIGDRLYVRESMIRQETDQGVGFQTYAADGADVWPLTKWYHQRKSIPSIHMPRWASRLTLIVTDVRVQRLQDISTDDAVAEGVRIPWTPGGSLALMAQGVGKKAFCDLWNSLHSPDAWAANPWVVAVSFNVRHGNIDAIHPIEAPKLNAAKRTHRECGGFTGGV